MNVLCLLPVNETQSERLRAAVPADTVTFVDRDVASDEQIAAADVIIGNLAPARLNAAQNLRLFQLNSAGYDKYAAPGIVPGGAIMACATGAYGQSVSEHMFAMVLAMMKRLPAYRDCQREHDWRDLGPVTTFVDAQVLVLGAGDIGTHFATLASAMGAHVTGMRRSAVEPRAPYERMATMDTLYDELGRADIVFSILPSCDATRGLANEKFFAACQPGALFANGGRGDLVVVSDLIAALESGHIAGAALDVTSPEPLPANDALWDAPNCFITPHVSGWYHLPITLENILDIAIENLHHLAAGEPIRNAVTL